MTTSQASIESLTRATSSQSVMNYAPIILGFIERGIPAGEIIPRENVFTFWAWKALGRQVRKGEHGVKATTFVPVTRKAKDGDTDGKAFRMARTVTVFHISQTEPIHETSAHDSQGVK